MALALFERVLVPSRHLAAICFLFAIPLIACKSSNPKVAASSPQDSTSVSERVPSHWEAVSSAPFNKALLQQALPDIFQNLPCQNHDQETIRYVYDESGKVTHMSRAAYSLWLSYNPDGTVSKTFVGDQGPDGPGIVEHFTWTKGQLTTRRNVSPDGGALEFDCQSEGRALRCKGANESLELIVDENGNFVEESGDRGKETRVYKDGHLISRSYESALNGFDMHFEYDQQGNLIGFRYVSDEDEDEEQIMVTTDCAAGEN